jgi:hypothetical protein
MLHENEMIMIVIGLTLLVFLVLNYRQLKQTPFFQLLFVSYCLSTTGWMMTVLEGFFFEASLNFIEHFACLQRCTFRVGAGRTQAEQGETHDPPGGISGYYCDLAALAAMAGLARRANVIF